MGLEALLWVQPPPAMGPNISAMGLSPCYRSDLSAMGLPPPPNKAPSPLLWVRPPCYGAELSAMGLKLPLWV